jgi:hypothetical protein
MSLDDFWNNLRIATRLVSPAASVDSPELDAGEIERALRASNLWLTPRAVQGFNVRDFDFLPDDERNALERAVAEFEALAKTVPSNKPATVEQVEAALPHLEVVMQTIRPDLFGDADAFTAGKRIERHVSDQLPGWVKQLKFNSFVDVNGDPGLWIWVVADDDALSGEALGENTRHVRQILEQTSLDVAPKYWPYVRFRSLSEQAEQVMAGR